MANFADGKIEAYVGPPGLGVADDLEAVIVEFIAGARRKLDIAVQELDSEAIAQAILDGELARRPGDAVLGAGLSAHVAQAR